MKKVVALTLVLEFSLTVFFFFFAERLDTVKTTYKNVGPFYGEFPASEPEGIKDKNWKGYTFKEGLRLFFQTCENPTTELEKLKLQSLKGKNLVIDYIPIGDSALIAFKPLKKGYSAISIIVIDTLVAWIDIISRGNTLDTKFQYFVNFLESLEYQGKKIAKDQFNFALSYFRKKISPLHMQSKGTFLVFIIGLIIFANILAFSALFAGGSCPKVPESDWELVTSNVMVYEKLPMGQKSYSACLVKREKEILILVFGKIRKKIDIEEIGNNLRFRGKTLIVGNSLRFELPDEDSLSKWQAIL